MASIAITWNTKMDTRTCPVCRDLSGFTWVFEVTDQPMPDFLTHPTHGIVWNKTVGSQAHGHQRLNCRCSIIPFVDVGDIKAKVLKLLEMVREMADRLDITL